MNFKKLIIGALSTIIIATGSYSYFVFGRNTDHEDVGSVKTKGIFFKDEIKVKSFADPTLKGVRCWVSSYSEAFSMSDRSNSSVSCRQVGEIDGVLQTERNIFRDNKNFLAKAGVVDRVYDSSSNSLVYISYTDDTGGKNASHSISVVVVKEWK